MRPESRVVTNTMFPGELRVISSPAHFRYLCLLPTPARVPTSPLVITLTIFPSRVSDLAFPARTSCAGGFSGTAYVAIKNKSNQRLIEEVLERMNDPGRAGGEAQK